MTSNLKITSWNVNGIKTLTPPFKDILDKFNSDIICFQETKTNEDTLTYKCAIVDGYNSYFSFCQTKPGYSGVCIYCRNPIIPIVAEQGFVPIIKRLSVLLTDDISIRKHLNLSVEELQSLESEGRSICCEFKIKECECGNKDENHSVFVINVYCPMTDSENVERIKYKTEFNELLQLCIETILSHGSHVLLIGDLNIKHRSIDIDETQPEEEFLANCHRQWFNSLLIESQRCPKISSRTPKHLSPYGRLVDSFRYLHPSLANQYTCWNTKIGARITNVGTRIDYILCDESLLVGRCAIIESDLLCHVTGSDHCPMTSTITHVQLLSANKEPSLCTVNIAKFRDQPRITSFFVRTESAHKRSAEESSYEPQKTPQKKFEQQATSSYSSQINDQWKELFKMTKKTPSCSGHRLPCIQRTVIKDGPNKGKKFWCCSKQGSEPNNPLSKCNYFLWSSD